MYSLVTCYMSSASALILVNILRYLSIPLVTSMLQRAGILYTVVPSDVTLSLRGLVRLSLFTTAPLLRKNRGEDSLSPRRF